MQYVAPAIERAKTFFQKRYPDTALRDAAMRRLTADVEGNGVGKADVVIEAIYENLDAKRGLYARLEPKMKPDAVLATNTSSIVLEQLSEHLADPARLIGRERASSSWHASRSLLVASVLSKPKVAGGRDLRLFERY